MVNLGENDLTYDQMEGREVAILQFNGQAHLLAAMESIPELVACEHWGGQRIDDMLGLQSFSRRNLIRQRLKPRITRTNRNIDQARRASHSSQRSVQAVRQGQRRLLLSVYLVASRLLYAGPDCHATD